MIDTILKIIFIPLFVLSFIICLLGFGFIMADLEEDENLHEKD
jgi:hypothetical protein